LLREKYGERFGSALGLELGGRGVSISEGGLSGDVDRLEDIQTPVQASGDEAFVVRSLGFFADAAGRSGNRKELI
jgi:hypothetical protein